MSGTGYWAPVLTGTVLLAAATVSRRHSKVREDLSGLLNALSLLAAGMIIGPLPWALDRGNETVRSTASVISMLASGSALGLMVRWRLGRTRRHRT
jgi:hypothetical protein